MSVMVVSLYVACCSVNVSCVACLTVFGETIRNVFGCGCYFVIDCYGCVCALLNRPCMVFQRVCVFVPVIPMIV